MEVSEERMDEDLRARMQNNIQLCEQYATFMKENVTIRMATLASQLSSGIFNAIRGKAFDLNILNELSQLLFKDNAANIEHGSVVLAFKNFLILAESFLRIREREAEARERVDNVPSYADDQYSIDRNPPRYLMDSPKRPKYEVGEEMDPVVQEIANSESGRQSSLENNYELEHEDIQLFENDDGPQIMDDGRTKVENEEGQMESGKTNTVAEDDGRMKRDEGKRTEKKGQSVMSKEKEKKEEQIFIVRSESRKRSQTTVTVNPHKGQSENTSARPQSMKRRSRKMISYEENDEVEEEEEQSMNDDLSRHSSTKRTKSGRTSMIIKKISAKRMSLGANRTNQTPSKKVVGANGKMVDQVKSFIMKEAYKIHMMTSPLSKTAATFGLKSNVLECPFCKETCGASSMNDHILRMHNEERNMKLFGCEKCNSWHRLPKNAMKHHREKGCKLRILSVDEAKKMNTSENGVNDSKESEDVENMDDTEETNEVSMPRAVIPAEIGDDTVDAPTIHYEMGLSAGTSESIHARK